MSIVIVATFSPRADQRENVLTLLEAAVPQVHQEVGCELYAIHQAKDELVVIEQWADKDALSAHGTGQPFTQLSASVEPLLAKPLEIKVLRPVPAENTGLGQLR